MSTQGEDAVLALALARRSKRERLAAVAALRAARLWRRLAIGSLTESWDAGTGRELLLLVTAAQLSSAQGAGQYVGEALAAQGADSGDILGLPVPSSLAGVAADGRSLAGLLYQPVVATKVRISEGQDQYEAFAQGQRQLQRTVQTEVTDAGRAMDGVAINARRGRRGKQLGYVRVLRPPSCGRCAILAGSYYSAERAFLRHPRCLPAGTVVSGPAALAATRRWYQGELVILRTASGQKLSITGNHPVLTARGWVPANLVQEGDHCVRSLLGHVAAPLVVPDERQVPALIEDVCRAGPVAGLERVPSSTEDFHGDGGNGEVDVVLANGLLRHGSKAALGQPVVHNDLGWGAELALHFQSQGAADQELLAAYQASGGLVGCGELGEAGFMAHLRRAHDSRVGARSDGHTGSHKPSAHHIAAYPEPLADAVFALTGLIGGAHPGWDMPFLPRWDPPAAQFSIENAEAYATRGHDLLNRLAGQVELDRVVEVSRVAFAGHVYNLTSAEGWYAADGLIVSNCDCIHLPIGDKGIVEGLTTNVRDYFDSLSKADQDKYFTKGSAQAIRDGGDIAQAVNARKGMSVAGSFLTRREGPELLGRNDLTVTHRGRVLSPTTRSGITVSAVRGQRLMPEMIYRLASDHDDLLRMLRLYGYLR